MKRAPATAALIAALAFLPGCSTIIGAGLQPRDNAARLAARPDAASARAAAPGWCEDALKTINALEHELERR